MKIIQNNKEYGYQQPIINNIDVLLDVSDDTNGLTAGVYNLNSSIQNYERLIFTAWPQNTLATINQANLAMSSEVSVNDFTTNHGCIVTVWAGSTESTNNYVLIVNNSSTSVKLQIGTGAKCRRIKVEGVKRTAQVSNLNTWEDITSKCTFANGFTSSNTKVYANPLFIYIGHYGNNGTRDNTLSITLPSGYEAFGCLAGNHLRATWSGAGAITSASNSSMTLGKGRYIWVGQPSGDSGNGILGGVLLRNV